MSGRLLQVNGSNSKILIVHFQGEIVEFSIFFLVVFLTTYEDLTCYVYHPSSGEDFLKNKATQIRINFERSFLSIRHIQKTKKQFLF